LFGLTNQFFFWGIIQYANMVFYFNLYKKC